MSNTETRSEYVVKKKPKMKPNTWLENKDNFITKSNYSNKYYLTHLGKILANYLKSVPIPVFSSYKPEIKSIELAVGHFSEIYKLDDNVSYPDFITKVKRFISPFFPQYKIAKEITRPYTEDEIIGLRSKAKESGTDFDINDILLDTITEDTIEHGVIDKIVLKKDEFHLDLGSTRKIYISGNKRIHPLSDFLKDVRAIPLETVKDIMGVTDTNIAYNILYVYEDIEESIELKAEVSSRIYNYIETNASLFKEVENVARTCVINYSGDMMYNFFKINYQDLKSYELEQVDTYEYKWCNYNIEFNSNIVMHDCLAEYAKMQHIGE